MSAARKYLSASSGFTIIEIVIASSIALFVFLVGYGAISSTVSASNISSARIRDTENARLFFNMLDRDLKSAYPGPTYMRKISTPVSQSGYTPPPSGQPILLQESTGSDILQFYCRTDHAPAVGEPLEQILFVQYGYNHTNKTLSRQATFCEASALPADCPDQKPALSSLIMTSIGSSDQAVFDNVERLNFTFQQWDPVNKVYLTPNNLNFVADSVLVTLRFGDARNGLPHNNSVYRSYTKVFPIPSSFIQ